jgi:hypothetical protein
LENRSIVIAMNGIDARRCLNLAENVLVPYMLDAKLCLRSRSVV